MIDNGAEVLLGHFVCLYVRASISKIETSVIVYVSFPLLCPALTCWPLTCLQGTPQMSRVL